MKKIMFNERYGLQSAVFEGRKTQTRRELFYCNKEIGCVLNKNGKLECYTDYNGNPIHTSRFAIGEVVAIAERYNDSMQNGSISSFDKGWKNKMFVKAELMPHHIKITDIRCERLQDINESDCIKEGVRYYSIVNRFVIWDYDKSKDFLFDTAKECFLYLLNLVGKKEHRTINPYVIVYEFEQID